VCRYKFGRDETQPFAWQAGPRARNLLAAGQAQGPISLKAGRGTRRALAVIRCAARNLASAGPSIAARDRRARRPMQ